MLDDECSISSSVGSINVVISVDETWYCVRTPIWQRTQEFHVWPESKHLTDCEITTPLLRHVKRLDGTLHRVLGEGRSLRGIQKQTDLMMKWIATGRFVVHHVQAESKKRRVFTRWKAQAFARSRSWAYSTRRKAVSTLFAFLRFLLVKCVAQNQFAPQCAADCAKTSGFTMT